MIKTCGSLSSRVFFGKNQWYLCLIFLRLSKDPSELDAISRLGVWGGKFGLCGVSF